MKGVGELCAGEPHAQFDGGELEKGRAWRPNMAALGKPRDLSPALPTAATSPAPYPTILDIYAASLKLRGTTVTSTSDDALNWGRLVAGIALGLGLAIVLAWALTRRSPASRP